MPKTIIKIKTWGCGCGYHQDFEPTIELMNKHGFLYGFCPSCKNSNGLQKEINETKKITHIIIGEEDIEEEISRIKLGEYMGIKAEDLNTSAKENAYRNKRKQDIKDAIKKSKALEDK